MHQIGTGAGGQRRSVRAKPPPLSNAAVTLSPQVRTQLPLKRSVIPKLMAYRRA